MELGDARDDRQAQSAAGTAAREAMEAIEDPRPLAFGNSRSVVEDLEHHAVAGAADADADLIARVAVTDGVKPGQEVVTAGAFKLRNNAPIVIDKTKKDPKPRIDPRPENR